MNAFWYVLLICIAVAVSFLRLYYIRKAWETRRATHHQYHHTPSAEASFDDLLKAVGMKPETMVTYDRNIFAYDREKGMLLIQTQQAPEGVLLHNREVLFYTLLRDGQTIAERSREGGEGIAAANLNSDFERIELRIEATHKVYPHIVLVLMPPRFEHAEARESAMDAARRMVEALEEILSKQA